MMGGAPGRGPGSGSGMMQDGGMTYRQLSCQPPTAVPGEVVRVRLSDMGMTAMASGDAPLGMRMVLRATPSVVTAGTVTLLVENLGWRTHELVVLPLAAGAVDGQRVPGADGKVDEEGSLGEASRSCASGAGEGIASGAAGWVTLELRPGHYELVCNLTNHYADGMHAELVVR
jgi:uncharacterized cupredoxin-like copper-binding protein